MVDRAAREGRELRAGGRNLYVTLIIGIAHDRVGIGNVEIRADQRHAEWGGQVVEEDAARIRLAVALGVAQQGDAIAFPRFTSRSHPGFHHAHDDVFRPPDRLDVRRLGFDNQNIAIGQDVDRARMLEALRERLDLQARRGGRRFSLFPADDLGQTHGREEILPQRRQNRIRTDLRHRVESVLALCRQ